MSISIDLNHKLIINNNISDVEINLNFSPHTAYIYYPKGIGKLNLAR